jgi:membrane-associated HD superfamily phosphohydrolase
MSLKQLIINAIIKVSEENPLLNHEDPKTAIASRDQFIQLLMDELFPNTEQETTINVPVVPVPAPVPAPAPVEEKKKRAPMTEEAKAAAKAKRAANAEAKKAAAAEVPSVLEPVVEAPVPEPVEDKKKRAPMTEEAKAAAKAKRAANAEAKKAAPENPNLAKIDPTWRKHLKAADKEHAKELEPELLKYVNALTNEAFNAKTAEAHVADFVASRSDGKVEAELEIVEFNGKDYYVNPETKRVYEGEGVYDEATQTWTNYRPVGYVGMSTFTHMKMD